MHDSLSYDGTEAIELPPARAALTRSLAESIVARQSGYGMRPGPVTLEQLATLLHYSYGVTREQLDATWPRPFRAAPSAGGLYPLEIMFYTECLVGQPAGLYHYNARRNRLSLLRQGNLTTEISKVLIPFQHELAASASLMCFITALFERTTFKYGDRGYRFALLEAGHVAQNLNLVATSMKLQCLNIGGYFDREVDELLELDGVTHSTLYMVAVGRVGATVPK
jgi:SagB-type dehydrogenase family enzyme